MATVGMEPHRRLWLNSRYSYGWLRSSVHEQPDRSVELKVHDLRVLGNFCVLMRPGKRVRPYLGALGGVRVEHADWYTRRARQLGVTVGTHVFLSPSWSAEIGFDMSLLAYTGRTHRDASGAVYDLAGTSLSLQVGIAFWPSRREP